MITQTKTIDRRDKQERLSWLEGAIGHKRHFAWLPTRITNQRTLWLCRYYSLVGGLAFRRIYETNGDPDIVNLVRYVRGNSGDWAGEYRNLFEKETTSNIKINYYGETINGGRAVRLIELAISSALSGKIEPHDPITFLPAIDLELTHDSL